MKVGDIYKILSLNNLKGEYWIPVKRFYGFYEISNLGRVKSLERVVSHYMGSAIRKEKILKHCFVANNRYLRVVLCKKGEEFVFRTARLMAKHFHPNPKRKKQVNHKNFIKTDNRAVNLEWSTQKENIRHRNRHNRHNLPKGENHYLAKKVGMCKNGKVIEKFNCIMDIERKHGLWNSNIAKVLKGNISQTGGYTFIYL